MLGLSLGSEVRRVYSLPNPLMKSAIHLAGSRRRVSPPIANANTTPAHARKNNEKASVHGERARDSALIAQLDATWHDASLPSTGVCTHTWTWCLRATEVEQHDGQIRWFRRIPINVGT